MQSVDFLLKTSALSPFPLATVSVSFLLRNRFLPRRISIWIQLQLLLVDRLRFDGVLRFDSVYATVTLKVAKSVW